MTDHVSDHAPSTAGGKLAPESVTLRAAPKPVKRLNARTLCVLIATLSAAVLGAALWSLRGVPTVRATSAELYNVDRVAKPEALSQLPQDYAGIAPAQTPDVPKLGPPLPGDLGETMMHVYRPQAQTDSRPTGRDEAEVAAISAIVFKSTSRSGGKGTSGEFDVLPASKVGDAIRVPTSPYQVMAGTVIAAALLTGVHSDVAGDVMATVTEPVYDSATGQYLLIPQGSRLLGRYTKQGGAGDERIPIIWHRIVFPDTTSIDLDKLTASDSAGYAGLQDSVDRHWNRLVAGAALTALLGVGAELATPVPNGDGNRLIIAGRTSTQEAIGQFGHDIAQRELAAPPTRTIRPGWPVRVIVNRDLVLRPYSQN